MLIFIFVYSIIPQIENCQSEFWPLRARLQIHCGYIRHKAEGSAPRARSCLTRGPKWPQDDPSEGTETAQATRLLTQMEGKYGWMLFFTFSPGSSKACQGNFLPQTLELRTMSMVSLAITSTTEIVTTIPRWDQHMKPWNHVVIPFVFACMVISWGCEGTVGSLFPRLQPQSRKLSPKAPETMYMCMYTYTHTLELKQLPEFWCGMS